MSYYFTDNEITDLISEQKVLLKTLREILTFQESDGHKKNSFSIERLDGSQFLIILRQNIHNINDFSVIFAFQEKVKNTNFKLRRYNGKSHEHTNKLEGDKFYNFHIHFATQRYQDVGQKEKSYAKVTDRYSDIQKALKCLLKDCNIEIAVDP
ncbi:MAG: hypothetical protein IH949_09525 [Bacteroidetes bacterium]|nr:hypothetical protein [Bacteroidota bacterium]